MTILLRGTSLALVIALLSGCAARKARTPEPTSAPANAGATAPAPPASLSEFMQKVRHLSAGARPLSKKDLAETLESRDPALAAELLAALSAPTAEGHRSIAERYRERGVLDAAYRHFNRAVALNPRDAAAYEGLARVWRDWGLPQLALGDAHRAAFYAPHSPSIQNTFGTVMQALGHYRDAKLSYELVTRLDTKAVYAVNNLCYLEFLAGRMNEAIETCNAALRLDPSLAAASNNLALAFAASGRMDLAQTQFLDADDRASGLYNAGIAYLASGDEQGALTAFDAASKARPTFNIARERANLLRARLRLQAASDHRGTPGQ